MTTAGDDWRLRAACRDLWPSSTGTRYDPFFPAPGEKRAAAERLCRRCDVRRECLADDLTRAPVPEEICGYRAGLTQTERRRLWHRHHNHLTTTTTQPS